MCNKQHSISTYVRGVCETIKTMPAFLFHIYSNDDDDDNNTISRVAFAFVTLKIFQIDFQLHNYERILDSRFVSRIINFVDEIVYCILIVNCTTEAHARPFLTTFCVRVCVRSCE